MRRLLAVAVTAAVVLLAPRSDAIFMQVFVDTVPVTRVIANLTRQVSASPEDGQAHWALARAHALAAANPAREVEVTKKDGLPWFGYTPRYVPFDPVPARTSAATATQIKAHLDKAIDHHRRAWRLLPASSTPIRLGLGWCLQQAGRRAEAITEYRAVVAAAWPKEGPMTSGPLGGHTLVAEAAGYLIPLLDPKIDREEIATLRARAERLENLPVPITPIVVDLAGHGDASRLLDADARVTFDLEGRGRAREWDWITPAAAWLVWDPQRTQRITSGTQLFGSVTFLMFWRTGYDALAALDDDGDGWLRDRELAGIAVWHDRDGDAVSDPGEVASLAAHRIVALATHGVPSAHTRIVARHAAGVRYADGRTAATFDVVLHPAAPRLTER